ncbi:hypothetical protein [Methanoregula sp.]|uniref:hypothetical protein n=1 Tax=Methanoregula sp. TaxID=2052170 RepID=UPI003BB0890B
MGIAPARLDAIRTYGDGDVDDQLHCRGEDGTGTEETVGRGFPLSPTYNHLTPARRSGSMVQQEHIHIISAGENIHTAYPAIFRTLPSITRTCVLAESIVYELSPNPETEKKRAATRNAVSAVKEISATLSISFSRDLVFPPVYSSVRDTLIRIHREVPEARFTFDLSGGAKPLCMALFAFAPWVGGKVYAAFDEKVPRHVPLPDRPIRSMLANPNYQVILALLHHPVKREAGTGFPGWFSREYLFKQLWSVYVPTRTKSKKADAPPASVVKYTHGRKPAAELTHGTFSDFMKSLADAGLVYEESAPENTRQKRYRITENGEIAFRFFSDPATSTLVRTVLEKE